MLTYRKRTIATIFIIIVIAFIITLWFTYNGALQALEEERSLHATLLVHQLVQEYVTNSNGQWPQSWYDLEKLPIREKAGFQWPKDSDKIQYYVLIDFKSDINKLAAVSIEQFSAIQPKHECYPYKDYNEVSSLFNTIHRYCNCQADAHPCRCPQDVPSSEKPKSNSPTDEK